MTKKACLTGAPAVFILTLLVISCGKGGGGKDLDYESTADARIVSAHSSGAISSESRIMVRFVNEAIPRDLVGKETARGVISVSPSLPGSWVWTDTRTIECNASKPLPRGVKYTVEVSPQKIDAARFASTSRFHFSFSIVTQTLSVESGQLQGAGTSNISELQYTGTLRTSDIADARAIEKTLSAALDGKRMKIEWSHSKVEHGFSVKGIVKGDKPQRLTIVLDGGAVDAAKRETVEVEIPQKGVFKVLSVKAVESPERFVEVSFSDPLLPRQDYRGFITANPPRGLRFTAQDTVLKVYSLSDWGDTVEISVKKGIKNAVGDVLSADAVQSISFKTLIPEVRFIGNGVILPQKEGVTVPVETVNLNAIIVEIQKIYADNIEQFLQVNELSDDRELNRVGKTIWKKIVPVPYAADRRNQWIRTALDLSPLVKDDRHSLYRIILSFDVRHIEYPGPELSEAELMSFPLENLEVLEPSPNLRVLSASFWDEYGSSRGERDYDDYYKNRNNPRHPAFYNDYYYEGKSIRASRNFLVSDLGIIAQGDSNNRLTLAVSNLLTAEPVADAVVSVFDYQLQKIAQVKTDSSGLASLTLSGEGFIVTAEARGTKGYLKLQGASNLPVSHFDVTGQEVQQGIKGFIYGERGVWRPGDPLYLTFILQDKNKVLPLDHPVILRLYDPSGRLVKTVRKNDPVGSFYHFALETGAEAPTGTYLAKVTVGGISFSKELPVETVKPNRLKISIGFGSLQELTTEEAAGSIEVRWLHGAVAGNMDTDVSVQLTSIPTAFPAYRGYAFDDPVRVFKAESKEVFKGSLDSEGKARFTMNLTANSIAPGKLKASFKTRVYEPGGNINSDTFSLPFHPFTQYAGISIPDAEDRGWLDVDQPHKVQIALVTPNGKPVPSGEVEIDVYEIGWRWWWDRQDDNIADYLGSRDYRLMSSEQVKVKGGAAEWSLKFKERVWGRYLVRVRDMKSGHATGQVVYMVWPGWYYSSPEGGGDSASMLVFSADKESYTVGETAKITIPTAQKGKALVSIENNGTLISTEWIETRSGQTIYPLRITQTMTPNVYVHVSLVQPHGQTVNDRPIRMFGIIPIKVEDPATRLSPVISSADVFEPNSTVRVSVSEASGKPMTYTLAVVDIGLLDLTRFATPDPWGHFFKRDAIGVSTFDMYGFVAAAYGGTLEKLLAVGGGEEGAGKEGRKANRFPPMVRFMGPFSLAQGKTATHEVSIPQYIGAVRVMAVAGSESAYGFAEKEVAVKKPVMVYGTLPRVVSVTEQFALPVSVFALENGISSVSVKVKAGGKIKVVGESSKTVSFASPGDQLVAFDLAALSSPGFAEVEITASAGKISSSQKMEIDVRVPNPSITTVDSLVLKKGETRDQKIVLPGLPGTNSAVLEVSKIAPINLERRLQYLIHYPYGCIEQTTSGAFPQLYLNKITELSEAEAAEVQRNVQAGIDRIQHFQTSSGGFGYWPGDDTASSYSTTYAAHFILEAERLGYVVPEAMKRNMISFLKTQVGRWSWNVDRSDFVQAYALFDLALAGEPDLGAMNRMRERPSLPVEIRYKLAAAYSLAGQKQEALRLTQGEIPPLSPYVELGGTFGSDLRDKAILAEGLLESGQIDHAAALINDIANSLSSEQWYSTQTTAYSLLVIGKYMVTWKTGAAMKMSFEWNGKREAVESDAPVKRVPLALQDESGAKSIRVANESAEPIYVRIVKTGNPAPGKESATSNGLSLSVNYYDRDNKPLDVSSLPQGTDIIAEIQVENPTSRRYEELAMTYMAPAGWEIVNPRFEGWSQDSEKGFEYQDIRDDRVFTFLGLGGRSRKSLKLMLNASYLGKFYLPQSKVEAMYDASINAAAEGKWITVDEAAPKASK